MVHSQPVSSPKTASRVPLLLLAGAVLLLVIPIGLKSSLGSTNKLERRPASYVETAAAGLPKRQDPNQAARAAAGTGGAPLQGQEGRRQEQQTCAIYNAVWFHLDVMAGLAWAFQEAGCKTDVYMHKKKARGLERVMEPWFKGQLLPKEAAEEGLGQYNLVVMATFPEVVSEIDAQTRLLLRRRPRQRLLLTVHNPRWLLEAAGPLPPLLLLAQAASAQRAQPAAAAAAARAGNASSVPRPARVQPVQLLSLAPCAAAYSSALFSSWTADMRSWMPGFSQVQQQQKEQQKQQQQQAVQLQVPWIVPLVPWAPPKEAPAVKGGGLASEGRGEYGGPLQHLCIQGSVEPQRRDYASAFAAASHPAVLAALSQRKEKLLLVGADRHASLEVPPALAGFVEGRYDLEFGQYYDTLSRCRALLTAFGSDLYLVNKTSSTMAAALQVGTPVLTENRVLDAYQYVPAQAAFTYRPPQGAGAAAPDPAALAAEEGVRASQQLRGVAGLRPGQLAARRLIEGPGEGAAAVWVQPWKQRLAALEAEDAGEEDHGLGASEHGGHIEKRQVIPSTLAAAAAAAEAATARQQPGRRRRAAEKGQQQQQPQKEQRERQQKEPRQQAERQQGGRQRKGGPADKDDAKQHVEAPLAGSYAAALLRAFDDDASRAAHTAAWRAKWAAMQRNVEAARTVLQVTAAWAAGVDAAST